MGVMLRRQFLASLAAAPLVPSLAYAAKNRIDRSRFAALTDEIATTPAGAIEFAHKYDLKWLELREIPGGKKHYYKATDEELKTAAKEFKDNGIRISFFNTPYLKITLPGTEPKRRTPETPEAREKRLAAHKIAYDTRIEELRKGINAAHILGVDKMRIFTFQRVAEPQTVFPQVAEILGEMAHVCEKEGIQLIVENEGSCNVGTSQELGDFMKLMPQKNVGLNWDPFNAVALKESQFPEGYSFLPKKRIVNVQTKGKSLLEKDQLLDWAAIFKALDHDGYQGKVGLETHYFDGTRVEKSHLSMQEMIRIVEKS
jgi:sugar phosphate isomerase/epimerase